VLIFIPGLTCLGKELGINTIQMIRRTGFPVPAEASGPGMTALLGSVIPARLHSVSAG